MRVSFNPNIQQPKFTAVNQKFLNEAKWQISKVDDISSDLLQRINYAVVLGEKMSAKDGIDTINEIKKILGRTDCDIEQHLAYLKNYLKNLNKG